MLKPDSIALKATQASTSGAAERSFRRRVTADTERRATAMITESGEAK